MGHDELEPLGDRQRRVLFALCREYVLTGRPVSSLSLAQRHRLEWSSATIRAELAQLERMGHLHQPHAAAGRFPSRSGLCIYLENIAVAASPRPEHRRAVDLTVASGPARASMRSAARVLGELAGCVGIGFMATTHAGVLGKLELVHVAGVNALVILSMEDGSRSVRRFELASPLEGREVSRLEDHLRALLVGRTLDQARLQLSALLEEHEASVDAWLAEAVRLGLLVCSSPCLDPLLMQVVGQANLAGARGVQQDLPRVLELLEDYNRLADVLCQLLPENDGKVRVRLGLPLSSRGSSSLSGLTLVGCRLNILGGSSATPETGALAVLGPDSMDFEAVIPLVEYAAKALASRA